MRRGLGAGSRFESKYLKAKADMYTNHQSNSLLSVFSLFVHTSLRTKFSLQEICSALPRCFTAQEAAQEARNQKSDGPAVGED
jgi:hypothetical protein